MSRLYAALSLALCVLLLPSPARAQQTIWSEDFSLHHQQNFSPPWGIEGNSYPWTCDYSYLIATVCFPYIGNETKVAGVSDYMLWPNTICGQTYKNETDVLLMTPLIPFSGIQNAWFQYDSYFLKQSRNGKTERATVEISTDSGATWRVLAEAPVTPPGGYMSTSYVDLSPYGNIPAIRLGFRYTDSAEYLNGWMIDNLKAFVPASNDIALIHAYPEDTMLSYFQAPAIVSLSGIVMNSGTAPITSFEIAYKDGNGPVQTHTVSGVNISAFDTFRFVHSIPYGLTSVGKTNLKIWAILPADTIRSNDTLGLSLRGAKFIPTKKLTIEEGTGTWNIQAPRGHVYMHALDTLGEPPTRIAVHANDVMGQRAYADYLYYMDQNFSPYFLFDRRGPVRPTDFFTTYEKQQNYFGFAEIHFVATAAAGHLSLDANIRPAIDLPGNYRLALVITEDGVHGTGSDYEQANGFAGGKAGPMGGFENMTDPVPASAMKYDYVARSISPTPEGRAGCLPANMTAGQTYTCNLHGTYSPESPTLKLNAIVLLIRDADSTILNSKSVPFRSLGIEKTAAGQALMQIYPNPAGNSTTIAFELPSRVLSSLSVTDITGKTVFQSPSGWVDAGPHNLELDVHGLTPGMYFVTLEAGGRRATKKLSVVH